MTKDSIAYYNADREPMSLRDMFLYEGKSIEDIFDAVADAETFDDITNRLRTIVSEPFAVDRVREGDFIRYVMIDPFGNKNYLKVIIE